MGSFFDRKLLSRVGTPIDIAEPSVSHKKRPTLTGWASRVLDFRVLVY